jgi:hypothetical protein
MYPRQIVRVYIRNLSAGKEGFNDRMEVAFAGVPLEKWSMFDEATEIKLPNNVV